MTVKEGISELKEIAENQKYRHHYHEDHHVRADEILIKMLYGLSTCGKEIEEAFDDIVKWYA